MQGRSLLLGCLLLCSCKESADYARNAQQERLRQFDSINKQLEASNTAMTGGKGEAPAAAQKTLDSFLNHTEEGQAIKRDVQQKIDSISGQQERKWSKTK